MGKIAFIHLIRLDSYDVAVEDRGSDWLDLASDQKTMFYTSEGGTIFRYDLSTKTQLPQFAYIGGISYAFRLLAPYDGTGGLIVTNTNDIKRLDGAGNVIQTYDVSGEESWFSMNLDPNGTSFWAGNFDSANFYKFNIDTGAVEVGPINTGTGSSTLFGICVLGEIAGGVKPMKLEKIDEGTSMPSGSDLTYKISFENDNTVDLHNVTLVDTLPADTIFVSATGGTGGWSFLYDVGPPRTVTWDIGTLPAGTLNQYVEITVRILAPPGSSITNMAMIKSDETVEEEAMVTTDIDPTPCMGTLVGDVDTISITGLKVVNFDLSAEIAYANRDYIMLGCLSGTAPGTLLPGGLATLPLNFDYFTNYLVSMLNTPLFFNFWSQLDGNAMSTAKLDASNLVISSSCVGVVMYFAFATYYPWDCVSNPVGVELIP